MSMAAASAPPPDVLLIDLSAIFRAAYHAIPPDTDISGVVQVTLSGVRRCVEKNPGALVAICCDGKGNWRKELSPEYKAHREKQPADMYDLLGRTKARLVADGYLLWECDGYEADDVIGTACELATKSGHAVTIASHDKDLCQLVSPTVRFLKTSTWDVLGPAEVEAKFGVPTYKIPAWLALNGDKSDNIKGVPGVGPKTAADLLTRHENGIAGIWQALDHAERETNVVAKKDALAKIATPAIVRALQQNRDTVELGLKLAVLKYDVPINFDEIYETRATKPITDEDDMTTTDADFDDVPISRPPARVSQDAQGRPGTDPPVEGQGQADSAGPEKASNVAAPVVLAVESVGPATGGQSASPVATTALEPAPAANEKALAIQATQAAMAEFNSDLQPTGMRGLWWLAKRAIESRSGKFKNENEALMVMLRGHDFGISPAAALDIFHVIEGKPCPPASLLIARAKAHPDCEYFQCVEADDLHAKWVTKNRKNPKETTIVFTFAQAETAKLPKIGAKGPNAWLKTPEDMCVKSGGAKLARREYPDATLGAYALEEMDA